MITVADLIKKLQSLKQDRIITTTNAKTPEEFSGWFDTEIPIKSYINENDGRVIYVIQI